MVEESKPQDAVDWKKELGDYLDSTESGRQAFLAAREGKPHDEKALAAFKRDLVRLEAMSMKEQPFIIPPADPAKSPDAWRSTGDALMEAGRGAPPHPPAPGFAHMGSAF